MENMPPVTTVEDRQLAEHFHGEIPCQTLTKKQILDNLKESNQILLCEISHAFPRMHADLLWSSFIALIMTATIPLLIVVMISRMVGQDFGKVLLFVIVLPAGLFGVWHFVIKDLATDRYWEWAFEKRIDLTTRELVILASSYDRKQRKPVSIKETFPIDDLELHYSRIDCDDFRQVGIVLTPSKAAKEIASAHAFNIEGFIYVQDSTQSLYEDVKIPEDVMCVAEALSKTTGIKLIPKSIKDLNSRTGSS